ncbi:MAG: cobalamin B12-binding domain-containing protein, partial [Burkholderiaceae bacterium]|nr:cobalamin B12-binding domain-containing protein [Burkholderiaceae bacterium]
QRMATIRPAQVEVFARALLERSPEAARALLAAHLEQGVALEHVFLDLFTATAQVLGQWWESDHCNFSQVTLCLSRMQAMLHELSPSFQAGAGGARLDRAGERRILMATLPGQQHTMGLSILAEFFRREGWVVLAIPAPEPGLIQATLSTHWFDVFALSASQDAEIEDLVSTIKAARKTSQNPRMAIMVGGPLFLRRPELALPMGADGVSSDAREALDLAQRLLQAQREIRLN